MATALFAIVLGNALIFGALGGVAVRAGMTELSPRIRLLSWAFGAVCAAFLLSALTRLALIAVSAEWLSGNVGDFLESGWVLVQSICVMALGIGSAYVIIKVGAPMRRAERIAGALVDQLPFSTPIAELGLTKREHEVLEVMLSGIVSDKDIAEALFISPATAGTHVRNILRKTGLKSRRDLALIAATEPD